MQTPMAKPQLSPNLPYKVEESETSQEIQIPKAEPQLSLRSPREVEESSEWILLIHNRHCIHDATELLSLHSYRDITGNTDSHG
jgi:hypothetical protein